MLKPKYVVHDYDPQLLVRFHAGLPGRLFGSLLLAMGGYLLAQLVLGVCDYFRYGQISVTIAGILMFTVMGLVFGVPGWLLAFTRKQTLLDPESREVEDVKDFLVYKRVWRYAFEAFAEVLVSKDVQTHRDQEQGTTRVSVTYPVELQGPEGVSVLVAEMDTPAPARELADRIATMVGVPVNDRTSRQRED